MLLILSFHFIFNIVLLSNKLVYDTFLLSGAHVVKSVAILMYSANNHNRLFVQKAVGASVNLDLLLALFDHSDETVSCLVHRLLLLR
jgi:hypothetical protein